MTAKAAPTTSRRSFLRGLAGLLLLPGLPRLFGSAGRALPADTYIRGPRYRVQFDRSVTPRLADPAAERRVWRNVEASLPSRSLRGRFFKRGRAA